MHFNQRCSCFTVALRRLEFQAGQRAHHNRPLQDGRQALGTGLPWHGALHIQVIRAHVGTGIGVLCRGVLRHGQLHPLHVQRALVRTAMEQIHIAQKAIDEGAGRVIPHLLRRALLLDVAFVDDHHTVCHLQRLFLVVGDEDAGHVQIVVQAAQPAAQFFAHFGVQCAEGLV